MRFFFSTLVLVLTSTSLSAPPPEIKFGATSMNVSDVRPGSLADKFKDANLRAGVIVGRVDKGGLADGAGLLIGDIIVAISDSSNPKADWPVKNKEDLSACVKRFEPGKDYKVTIYHMVDMKIELNPDPLIIHVPKS
ncbi:MAG: hypothetical protein JWP44_4875 [Mucilaginibacter sp.]|nr:hypothetical protein [Mucilaginibacter sp.]